MRSIYAASLAIALTCCGCGSYFKGVGQNAATGAVDGITTDDSKKKLTGLVTDATKAARDEALSPETDQKVQKLITDSGATARAQLETLTTSLQTRLRQTVRLSLDELGSPKTLKDADALREELVGPPLQKDVNDLIDAAAPHLASAVQQAVQSSLAPLKTEEATLKADADQEASKWKPIAIGFGVGTGILLVCLVFAAFLLRHHRRLIDSHQRLIETLIRQRDPIPKS